MSRGKNVRRKDIFESIVNSHELFIEATKDAHSLSVLAALSIAIAAFTSGTAKSAQPYAVSAAFFFLIAYTCSFCFKALPSFALALSSYLSTLLGIVCLFCVIYEFAISNISAGSSVLMVPFISVAILSSYFLYDSYQRFWSKGTQFRFVFISQLIMAGFSYFGLARTGYDIFVLGTLNSPNVLLFVVMTLSIYSSLLLYGGWEARLRKERAKQEQNGFAD